MHPREEVLVDISSFVQEAAGKLGVEQDQVGKAVGGILKLIQEKAEPADAKGLMDALPGAAELAGGGSGGGLMGQVMGAAAGMLGGKAGAALDAAALFQGAGLDAGQGVSLLGMFLEYARKNAGPAIVERILGQVPQLKGLLG